MDFILCRNKQKRFATNRIAMSIKELQIEKYAKSAPRHLNLRFSTSNNQSIISCMNNTIQQLKK